MITMLLNPTARALFCLFAGTYLLFISSGCNEVEKKAPPPDVVIVQPENTEEKISETIKEYWNYAQQNQGKLSDTVQLYSINLTGKVYEGNNFQTAWSNKLSWLPIADSLFYLVEHAKEYGLFPSDYHFKSLQHIRTVIAEDSISRKNAALWSKADLLFSDAYFTMAQHLKFGRLKRDSITLRTDSVATADYYLQQFQQAVSNRSVISSLNQLEPQYNGYQQLKMGIRSFLDSASFKPYTYLVYPSKDSLGFVKLLQQRLMEGGFLTSELPIGDTSAFRAAITAYQKSKGLKATGRYSETLVRSLNNTDWEKFKRIAINLDRYKQLPDTLPSTHIWVNLPSYTFKLIDGDTLSIQSKVIVGNPKTRTPVLNSEVVNFITYPQWTVPYSIIFKEMLPKIQKDTQYLVKENLMVVDKNDSVLSPSSIDWSKLNRKYFPYLLKQRQGDDNSLGVIKFNFRNKYAVYLHDTNARWMFSKSARALSHGCVRLQQWEKLSRFLVRNDTLRYPTDTLKAWIARQEKHQVTGFPKVPIYIRYVTCEGIDGKVKFYDDIYGDDRALAEKYFANKPVE
jgi:murein L,D-transpeptidase YcbB/YkuD